MTLLVTLLVVAGGPSVPLRGPDPRAAVALVLYGQDDPDAITAAGLHGLGGSVERVVIRQLDSCRFELVAGRQHETLDFGGIATIRHTTISDPAAGLARSLGHGGSGALPHLAVAILAGQDDATCADASCSGRRIFALTDPSRLDDARRVAVALQRRCRTETPVLDAVDPSSR